MKKRLDILVFEKGFAESREKAKAIIMAGQVYVDNQKADKCGTSYDENARALITVIAAPTLTPTVYATRVPQTLEIHYVSEDGLSVGTVVEVYDTGSTGLSVRPQPGTGGYLNFVASEGERFKIIDGPDSRNNYIWWKIESVNNPDRNGWAASDYLRAVN